MAEPVPQKPVRQFSFSAFSQTQPSKPQPGAQIDTELTRNATAIATTIDFVRQAIADDGRVRGNMVDLSGFEGAAGPDGPQGPTGNQGAQGPTGNQGPQGSQGVAGAAGSTGLTGPQGPTGPQGGEGPTGQSFDPDQAGVTAERSVYDAEPKTFAYLDTQTGIVYWKLSNGFADWSTGVPFGRGPQGYAGATGPQGVQGNLGPQGSTGATGPQGPQGSLGPTGPAGASGTPGTVTHYVTAVPAAGLGVVGNWAFRSNGLTYEKTGASVWTARHSILGPNGTNGTNGTNGATGPQGPQGDQGTPGPTGATGATGATGPATPGVTQLAGRNLIINGSGRVNQRAYVSAVATTVANQFTLDRWFVVTSGQNLTFTGNDAGRTMTAPAGGVSQVIEGANIVGGTYVINWTGTATCTVGGVARLKGATFTLTANTNVTVRFTGGTYTDVQVELGTVATAFERVNIGPELTQCQRYYETGFLFMQTAGFASNFGSSIQFAATKRAAPTMAGSAFAAANTTGVAYKALSPTGFGLNATPSANGAFVNWQWTATSELTA